MLAALRSAFFALKDDYLGAELYAQATRSIARHLLTDTLIGFVPAVLFSYSISFAKSSLRWISAAVLTIAAVALGYFFVSFRWPAYPFYTPGTYSTLGWITHGVAALVALVSAWLLGWTVAPRVRRASSVLAIAALSVSALMLVFDPGLNRSDRPNLILISLDTLRRNHLGCYGYERATSPEIDRFAARSLLFTNAFTPQPWTLTAHMSMLTGLYPSAHDLETDRALPSGVATLAERLGQVGYDTMAIVDRVALLQPRFGFGRGFDYYQQLPDIAAMKRRRVEELLDDSGSDPFFLFLHFYDAHSDWRHQPYEAYPEDVESFAGEFDSDHPWHDDEDNWASKYLRSLRKSGQVLSGEPLNHLISLYDAGLRSLDRELGLLLMDFEQRGLFQNTVILITADHGEEFFDHGMPMHKQSFDECSNIPFLLYTPTGEPGVTDELASLVDIAATLMEFAGAPATETQGLSLAPLTRGEPLESERDIVVLESRGGHLGFRGIEWSLVPSAEELQLFDLRKDPGQLNNLLEAYSDAGQKTAQEVNDLPDIYALLEREAASMNSLRERLGMGQVEVELSSKELDQLRALGYAGDD